MLIDRRFHDGASSEGFDILIDILLELGPIKVPVLDEYHFFFNVEGISRGLLEDDLYLT